jgi:hypothetical protein
VTCPCSTSRRSWKSSDSSWPVLGVGQSWSTRIGWSGMPV